METIKLIKIEDCGLYVFKVPRGNWIIDGKKVATSNYETEVQSKSNEIRKIDYVSYISHYETDNGESLSRDEYDMKIDALTNNKQWIIGGDLDGFPTLEDEFNYRKFRDKWRAVCKNREVISDPIPIVETLIKLETGNPYISSIYLTSDILEGIYVYRRYDALLNIVKEKFEQLGMEFKDKCSYSQTENAKIWGNSSHSGLEYVVAFGSYIFGEKYRLSKNAVVKGTLEYCVSAFEKDKSDIERIIDSRYNAMFNNVKISNEFATNLINKIDTILKQIDNIQPMKKDYNSFIGLKRNISSLKESVGTYLSSII